MVRAERDGEVRVRREALREFASDPVEIQSADGVSRARRIAGTMRMLFRVVGEGPTAPRVASAAKPDGFVGRFGFGFGFGASRRSRDERGRRERAPGRSRRAYRSRRRAPKRALYMRVMRGK